MNAFRLNWGLIGPGKISHTFATALVENANSHFYAVASRNKERASAFAEAFKIETVYSSYDALCKDDKVDAVYIGTPHAFHFQQAKMCLEAGKHVLVEKPATINAMQWQVLTKLAQQNQCTLIEAVWSRFMPCFQHVLSWIDAGKIGDVNFVQSDIGFSFLETRQQNYQHRLFDINVGGGALLDLGIYSIALGQLVIKSQATDVQAMVEMGPTKVDHTTMANVLYANGIRNQFTCSAVSDSSNQLTINGTKGHIKIDNMFWAGNQAMLVASTNAGKSTQVEKVEFPHAVNGFEYQIAELIKCVANNQIESPLMPHCDTLDNLQLMDTIRDKIGLVYPQGIESIQ